MSLPDWTELSLTEQVAQMVVVRTSGFCFDHQMQYPALEATSAQLRHWIQDLGVGGVILLGGSAIEVGLRSQQLQDWAAVPLLMAADIEEGVGQRFSGATWFPPPMALGAIARDDLPNALELAEAFGSATAQEAIAIGLNWVLAPVVDINNNPRNPVVNVRAFGDEPDTVSQLATAFLRGAQHHSVLTTAKHFPGHGDTDMDSHLELPVLLHDRQRLDTLEFVPFQAAIAAGVDAVMTAHVTVPALDADDPATLSKAVLTNCLRHDLGFDGLIVTDALVMGAIARQYGTAAAAVQAVQAGADIVLMPSDPVETIRAISTAVETGNLSRDRLQSSLDRIWNAKHRILGAKLTAGATAHRWETVSPPAVDLAHLATPAARSTAQTIAAKSIRQSGSWPRSLDTKGGDRMNLVVVDTWINCPFLGLNSPAVTIPTQLGYRLYSLDRHSPAHPDHFCPKPNTRAIVQLFVRGNPFRGGAGLSTLAIQWLQRLYTQTQLEAVLIYGSPYVIETCQAATSPDLPYLFSYGQMAIAQTEMMKRLFGETELEQSATMQPFTD
jgi:beta-glucosidase